MKFFFRSWKSQGYSIEDILWIAPPLVMAVAIGLFLLAGALGDYR